MVNTDKSEILFSKNVPSSVRNSFCLQLGISEVTKINKYLGLPAFTGRSKKELFKDIQDRLSKRINHWSSKNLSQAGREVPIKSIGQAIPSYAMSIFKLPKSVSNCIHRDLANCWWGRNHGKNKLHWCSWDHMCKAKGEGGMNFWDISLFNDALLAKQSWRLWSEPESMLSIIIKQKYYPKTSVLDATVGANASYIWKSICEAKYILNQGLVWRVGNGKSINIWRDKWTQFDLETPPPTGTENWTVAHLIDHT